MTSTPRGPPAIGRAASGADAGASEGEDPAQVRAELRRFGACVRRQRVAASLTQERLAEAAGLNIRTLQRIEAGEINVLITTAARLRAALGCAWEQIWPSS